MTTKEEERAKRFEQIRVLQDEVGEEAVNRIIEAWHAVEEAFCIVLEEAGAHENKRIWALVALWLRDEVELVAEEDDTYTVGIRYGSR